MHGRLWLLTTVLCVSVLLMVGSEKGAVVSGSATVADLTCASSATRTDRSGFSLGLHKSRIRQSNTR
jgi:hypothetical protein